MGKKDRFQKCKICGKEYSRGKFLNNPEICGHCFKGVMFSEFGYIGTCQCGVIISKDDTFSCEEGVLVCKNCMKKAESMATQATNFHHLNFMGKCKCGKKICGKDTFYVMQGFIVCEQCAKDAGFIREPIGAFKICERCGMLINSDGPYTETSCGVLCRQCGVRTNMVRKGYTVQYEYFTASGRRYTDTLLVEKDSIHAAVADYKRFCAEKLLRTCVEDFSVIKIERVELD